MYQTSLHVVMADTPKSQHKLVYQTIFLRLVEFLSFLNAKLTNWLFSFFNVTNIQKLFVVEE